MRIVSLFSAYIYKGGNDIPGFIHNLICYVAKLELNIFFPHKIVLDCHLTTLSLKLLETRDD